MKISARNQINGAIVSIKNGAVNTEVVLKTPQGDEIVSVVTHDALLALGLNIGGFATAIVKAQNVLVAKANAPLAISARNKIKGTIKEIKVGAVNCEVVMVTSSGLEVVAIVTEEAKKDLALFVGDEVYAIIKASNVLIGVA